MRQKQGGENVHLKEALAEEMLAKNSNMKLLT